MADANHLDVVTGADRLDRRAQIASLEDHLKQCAAEHGVETGLRHLFASGVYVREAFLPAGTLAIGKLHKAPHITVLLQGRVTITTEEGSETYEAPLTLVAPAGIKRVAYAHTDVIWQSIHNVGEERDLEVIEGLLIAKDFDDPALPQEEPPCLS
jgi:hypothetical protein